jgi:hypothetical protein
MMTNADFLMLVTDLCSESLSDSRFRATLHQSRRTVAVIDTSDMVLFAYMVAAHIQSDSYGLPFPEEIQRMLKVPGSYLHRVAYRRCAHEWHDIMRAADYYAAGIPAELVAAANNSMSSSHGRGEWSKQDVGQMHALGVPPEYVRDTKGIVCSVDDLAALHTAGVPPYYALALAGNAARGPRDYGMKPKRIISLWQNRIPVEYAVA